MTSTLYPYNFELMEISGHLYEYEIEIIRIVDADTMVVKVDLGFGIKVKATLRLFGINAYETRLGRGTTEAMKRKGLAGKRYVQRVLRGRKVWIRSILKDRRQKQGSFKRYLVVVTYEDKHGHVTLNQELINRGYAVMKKY